VLYSFIPFIGDGYYPRTGVVRDKEGNLYGTTTVGGNYNYGVLFKVDQNGNETLLHSFNGTDGNSPLGNLILAPGGNLIGTTYDGGFFGNGCDYGCGVVFRFNLHNNQYSILHRFRGFDGNSPMGRLLPDTHGNLYQARV
jgi:uncharacterized repeat protein (TIGR03803 family)